MTGWLIAFAVAQALDAGTSCAALQHGAREGNPLLPSTCGRMIAVKAGMTAGYGVAMRPAFQQHPRLARIVTGLLITSTVAVAIHNTRQ